MWEEDKKKRKAHVRFKRSVGKRPLYVRHGPHQIGYPISIVVLRNSYLHAWPNKVKDKTRGLFFKKINIWPPINKYVRMPMFDEDEQISIFNYD